MIGVMILFYGKRGEIISEVSDICEKANVVISIAKIISTTSTQDGYYE